MAMLPDGRVLLFGGKDKDGKALGDTWVLGPAGKAQQYAPGRNGALALAASLGGMFAPWLAPQSQPALQATGEDWTQLNPANSPKPRADASLIAGSSGKAYLFGGMDEQGNLFNDLYTFDGKQWNPLTAANNPPLGRFSAAVWENNNNLYVQGGIGKKDGKYTVFEDLWGSNLTTNTWTELPKPPAFISPNASPIVQDGKAYLLDPHRFSYNQGTIYTYNTPQNLWEQIKVQGDLPPGERSGYAIVQAGSNAYMFGGALWDPNAKKANYTREVWIWEGSFRRFTRLEDMPFPISDHGAVYDWEHNRFIIWGGQQAVDEFFDTFKLTQFYN